MGHVEGWGEGGDGLGGEGVGVYGGGWYDSGVRGGVFSVGSVALWVECGRVWVGVVGACGGGVGGVFAWVCELLSLSVSPPCCLVHLWDGWEF